MRTPNRRPCCSKTLSATHSRIRTGLDAWRRVSLILLSYPSSPCLCSKLAAQVFDCWSERCGCVNQSEGPFQLGLRPVELFENCDHLLRCNYLGLVIRLSLTPCPTELRMAKWIEDHIGSEQTMTLCVPIDLAHYRIDFFD